PSFAATISSLLFCATRSPASPRDGPTPPNPKASTSSSSNAPTRASADGGPGGRLEERPVEGELGKLGGFDVELGTPEHRSSVAHDDRTRVVEADPGKAIDVDEPAAIRNHADVLSIELADGEITAQGRADVALEIGQVAFDCIEVRETEV